MRTAFEACLKVLLVLVAAVLLAHFAPFVALPVAVILAGLLGLGALVLTVGGIAGAAVMLGLLLAAVGLVAALSPIWILAGLILGIVWLVKRLGSNRPRPGPAAQPPLQPA